jgi:hypothetical protein
LGHCEVSLLRQMWLDLMGLVAAGSSPS